MSKWSTTEDSTTTAKPTPFKSKWHEPPEASLPEDEVFGGVVWNQQANQYNGCFKFDAGRNSFAISQVHVTKGAAHEHFQAAVNHLNDLNKLQQAVGRLAFSVNKEGVNTPDSTLSGVFISPTKFITRAHGMNNEDDIAAAKVATHKITIQTNAQIATLQVFPASWFDAILETVDLDEDFAVYSLVAPNTVPYHIPLSNYYDGEIQVGDNIAAIVYNGLVKKSELDMYFNNLPDNEKPAYQLTAGVAAEYLSTDTKSLAPGKVVALGSVDSGMEDLFMMSSSVVGGSLGGPIFLLRDNLPPAFIGLVLGGRVWRNFNRATRLTPEMRSLMN
jgi:hypothetical protein